MARVLVWWTTTGGGVWREKRGGGSKIDSRVRGGGAVCQCQPPLIPPIRSDDGPGKWEGRQLGSGPRSPQTNNHWRGARGAGQCRDAGAPPSSSPTCMEKRQRCLCKRNPMSTFFFSCGNDHWCPPQGGHSACSGGFLPRSHPQKRAMLMGSPWNRSTIYGKTCRAHRRSFGDRSPPVGCHPQSADRPRSQTAAVARHGEPGSCGEPAAAAPPLPACRARSPPPAVTGGGASWPPSPPPNYQAQWPSLYPPNRGAAP